MSRFGLYLLLCFIVLHTSKSVHLPTPAGGSENCTDNDIRLLGGNNEREGVVQICYKGVWGTVCDSHNATTWNNKSANVVCRQLGFLGLNQSNF